MSILNILNHETYVLQEGQGKDVVCLYGWGQDTRMFEPTLHHLSSKFRVTLPDFPGFGQSQVMESPWGVPDYVDWLKALFTTLKIEKPIIIAHSFGARVALLYASMYPVEKLILTGAAGLRPKRSFAYYLRVYSFKTLKQLKKIPGVEGLVQPYLKQFGSDDYKALDGVLKQSFVKIVNEDLRYTLAKINCPTLLIWGSLDDATPLWMGQVMEKEIKDCGLVIFENDGHYAYWNQLDRFHRIIDVFLKDAHNG